MDKKKIIATLKEIHFLVESVLGEVGESTADSDRKTTDRRATVTPHLSFDVNPRAFMKKHANNMSGPEKFTLLLARLAKGELRKEVSITDIQSEWNRMKGVLKGPFNTAFSLRAKENGWVNAPKKGVYVLTDTWQGVTQK